MRIVLFTQDVIVVAGGNTHWPHIHAAAKRKAKRLFARCANPIEYQGIDHNKTEHISENPVRCKYHCLFDIIERVKR